MPAYNGEKFRHCKPQAHVQCCHQEPDYNPCDLFTGEDEACPDECNADHPSAEREYRERDDGCTCQELRDQNRIAVDRLCGETVQRSLRQFFIDRVKTEHDADDRSQESHKRAERKDIVSRRRENPEEQKFRNGRLPVRGLLCRRRKGGNCSVQCKCGYDCKQHEQNLKSGGFKMICKFLAVEHTEAAPVDSGRFAVPFSCRLAQIPAELLKVFCQTGFIFFCLCLCH